jgi:phosphatidylserine decarboxylase
MSFDWIFSPMLRFKFPMQSQSNNALPAEQTDNAFLRDWLRNLPQYLLPQRLVTRTIYKLTRITTPWFKNALIRAFIRHYQVDMSEAAEPDPLRSRDFNHFFTRPLHSSSRPLAAGNQVVCCPVDGIVSQAGELQDDSLVQAKGRLFSLNQLLGGTTTRALPFRDGSFATLYLAPRDYHRIHMPLTGRLREMVHIPGKLFSVSPLTTRVIPQLFACNERVVVCFDTLAGPMALVLIGAINVASIETVWAGTITPPLATQCRHWDYPETGPGAIDLEKGAEMGRFNMGSTVIVLFGKQAVRWDPAVKAAARIRMGQKLGEIVARQDAQMDKESPPSVKLISDTE